MKSVLRFLRDERGTETVEWAVVLGVITVGAITLAVTLGGYVAGAFDEVRDAFQSAGRPAAAD